MTGLPTRARATGVPSTRAAGEHSGQHGGERTSDDPPRWRRWSGALVTVLAVLLVWVALVAPVPVRGWRPAPVELLRLPAEGIVLVLLLLAVREGVARCLGAAVGVVLGALLAVRVLDVAFFAAMYRPFNPLTDWRYAGAAGSFLGDSTSPVTAVAVAVGAGLALLLLLVLTPWAVGRVRRALRRHRRTSLRATVGAAAVWVVLASVGWTTTSVAPVASTDVVRLASREATGIRDGLRDRDAFAALVAADPMAAVPARDLLTVLRGKDVLVVFVESYGRVAVEASPEVDRALTAGTEALGSAGYAARSAWLTSPTFGGFSWLAHSTLQSGLWVDTSQRYDQLLDTGATEAPRLSLTRAFAGAGWRTVAVVPADRRDWPEGEAFYGYDRIYDARSLGYAGPGFGYAPVPDQFTLAVLDRAELGARSPTARPPVMAEVDLVTSHVPWAPLPRLVDWASLGDGSVYAAQARTATPADEVWSNPQRLRAAYGASVAYSLDSIVGFLQQPRDQDPVVVVLGDHQPVAVVSGEDAGHDVPISILSSDPVVLQRISSWSWDVGLRPGPSSPVWAMDRFRDAFLTAFSPRAR